MGAKDWFICNADRNVASVLGARPELDRLATEELVGRLFPTYAAVWPGAAIVCTGAVTPCTASSTGSPWASGVLTAARAG